MTEVAPASAGFQPWIRLVSPTGVVLGSRNGVSAAQIVVTAPTTGTYTVIVGTVDGFGGNDNTGNYLLRVDGAPGRATCTARDEGGAMTNAVNHAGSIYLGDLDQ